jgi:hypothetical protein
MRRPSWRFWCLPRTAPERWAWGWAGILGGILLLVTWPLAIQGLHTVPAAPDQELAAHLWGWQVALAEASPFQLETKLVGWPTGIQLPLIDPINIPTFAIGYSLSGPALGYNLVWIQGLLLMAGAAHRLARLSGISSQSASIWALACPFLVACVADGQTEAFGVGLVGVHAAAAAQFARQRHPSDALVAALAGFGCTLAGPYNLVWAALLDGVLFLGNISSVSRLWRHALLGWGGLLSAAPLWAQMLAGRPGQPGSVERAGLPPAHEAPGLFRGGMQVGADLLDGPFPDWMTGSEAPVSHTTYLGLSLILLALRGLSRRPQLWPFALAAFLTWLFSLGPWPTLLGIPISFSGQRLLGPAGVLATLFPLFARMTRWYRVGAVCFLCLLPLASAGLPHHRFRRYTTILLVLFDLLLWAPHAWPLRSTPLPDAPFHLPAPTKDEPTPAILELPTRTEGQPPPGGWRDENLLWQTHHHRPIAGGPPGFGLTPAVETVLAALRNDLRNGTVRPTTIQRAHHLGFGFLHVDLTRHPLPSASTEALHACLGTPLAASHQHLLFPLSSQGCRQVSPTSPSIDTSTEAQ